jgi:two-component system sensor histidine kinase MprB
VQFVRRNGISHLPPDEHWPLPVNARTRGVAASGSGRFLTDLHVDGEHVRVLVVGRGPMGAIQVARPLNDVDNVMSKLLIILIVVGAGGIAVAAVLGAVVARTALSPVARFTRRTEALTGHPDLSQRLEVKGKDELARLALSFNATLDALERSVESQRHLVADASHELRTPIASLRANIQVLQDAERLSAHDRQALRADIIEELDELTALVGDVVELARGAASVTTVDDVRLDQITADLIERTRRRAPDVAIHARLEPAVVSGEPDRISRAVSNLLDNARRWSPQGASIEVELAGGVLTIRDHGPGFDEKDLAHVFDRFYRAASARRLPGSGLGLAIVRQAAEAHGGWVKAANAPDGGGIVRVNFGEPLSAPDVEPDAAPRPTLYPKPRPAP